MMKQRESKSTRKTIHAQSMALFAENLSRLMDEQDLSGKACAERIGVTPSAISLLTRCKAAPSMEMIDNIANALNVPVAALFGGTTATSTGILSFPVTCAQDPNGQMRPGYSTTLYAGSTTPRLGTVLAFFMRDYSMSPSLAPGDIVFYNPEKRHENGSLVAFNLDGTVTARKLVKAAEGAFLFAENPAVPPVSVPSVNDPRILGVVVSFQHFIP